MLNRLKITPCLWFDHQAEEAAKFYCGIFPDSRLVSTTRYTSAGFEFHGKPAGSVMTVAFELDGQPFVGLNGGPVFRFSEAISFQIACSTQAEVDHYWDKLGAGGDPAAQQCGWLKDQFGVSWQVVPYVLTDLLQQPDAARAQRVTQAMLGMKKLDIDALTQAAR